MCVCVCEIEREKEGEIFDKDQCLRKTEVDI